ncbi:DNA double-strand break repair nuclease NurA [Longispora sp. NPDC051575]|uniref:DNA double-strand break repair nuclease NurA n=1 Tax=Longispora sp. NPDC051575 TaxID=3154943 RepID=UPI003415BCF8
MRMHVDTWDPGYGTSLSGDDRAPSKTEVETDLEMSDWRPVTPGTVAEARLIRLVDGVRRIDARVWLDSGEPGPPSLGVAASYAAGVVTCDLAAGSATLDAPLVERALFTAERVAAMPVRGATYISVPVGSDDPAKLDAGIQSKLRELEIRVAQQAGDDHDLLIVDGPLQGRSTLPRVLGYIKTHRAQYLPPSHTSVVNVLDSGQRTPIFRLGSPFPRLSWYVQLPGGDGAPWAGVVRVECPAELSLAEAVALADLSAVTLPRLASSPYKDPRAPQNLLPIGGLERRLRALLGDARLLHRSLRLAVV